MTHLTPGAPGAGEPTCTCPSGDGSLRFPCLRHSPPVTEPLRDAMIDIETLGTKPGAAILSIGAVMFGPAGLGETFYAPVLLQSCINGGLMIESGTVAWWMRQSDEARAAAFRDDAAPLHDVLRDFRDWFLAQQAKHPWCHGATFDVPVLEAAFKACGIETPWQYWSVRDTRTLYDLAGVKVDRTKGTHHNALDDARSQAEAAVKALRMFKTPAYVTGKVSAELVAALEEAAETRSTTALLPGGSAVFINYGEQPEDTAHLSCTACGGSGHIDDLIPAARDVLAERRRQVEAEGMTNEGDDRYRAAELPRAAAAYILNGANDDAPYIWPWEKSWWKPRDARANYVRAAALLLAEIERLDRATAGDGAQHE